jgi:hypothetical protein
MLCSVMVERTLFLPPSCQHVTERRLPGGSFELLPATPATPTNRSHPQHHHRPSPRASKTSSGTPIPQLQAPQRQLDLRSSALTRISR